MCSLGLFPPPPPRGQVTGCEVDGHLVIGDIDGLPYTKTISSYPKLSASLEINTSFRAKDSLKSAFLPRSENVWRRAITAFEEHGFLRALEELRNDQSQKGVVGYLAKLTLMSIHWIRSLHGSFYPHLMLTNEQCIEEFSLVTDWKEGLIRAFAWHPHTVKFAVAFRDDSVKIYNSDNKLNPVLKYRQQKGVCDLAWRCLSASTLAVACMSGIAVWNIDPTSVVTRPSSSYVQWLSYPGHSPVTSVEWSTCGKLLYSSSPRDSSMMIWDVAMNVCVPLRSVRGGGVSLVCRSPDGQRVFAATPSNVFRVWETQTWTWDWWSTGSGRCQAACWSPDGQILLIAMKDEPSVYSLTFSNVISESGDRIGGSKSAISLINLSPVIFDIYGEHLSIGSCVQSMIWDKTGSRLALTFSSKGGRQELVAVFRTRIEPTLDVHPCGFVRGSPGAIPQCIAFQDGFDEGALLTVCWSSGTVSHIPFLFPTSLSNRSPVIFPKLALNFSSPTGLLYSLDT